MENDTDTTMSGATEATDLAARGIDTVAEAATDAGNEAAGLARDTAEKSADAFAQTSADMGRMFEQARGRLQQMGVPGLDFGQSMLDQFKANTDRLSQQFTGNYGRTAQALAEFNAKAVEAWRTNAEATISHWQSLTGVASWSEMIALNTSHIRKQMETMTAQTRELAEIAARIARDQDGSSKPAG